MSAVMPLPLTARPWRHALPALVALLVAIGLLYRDTAIAMVEIWNRSETFAHAFLVPPIVLWLVWRLRHRVAALTPRPQPWVLLPMAAVAGVWMLGDVAGVNSVTQLMFTALLVLAVPAVLGLQVAKALAFPLGFLFFMVPIGDFLLGVMMEATADFTVAAVSLSGVPVYREGLQFVIPTGTWSVVEACSGVRYLIASFMVGTLFAYLNYTSTKRRLIFCAVSIVLPVVANWLRAYMIVMLGHLSGNKLAVGVDHLIYGWVFFGVVILLMFMIGARWSEPAADLAGSPPSAPSATAAAPAAGLAPYWVAAALALVLIALPQGAAWRLEHGPALAAPKLVLPDLAGAKVVGEATLLDPFEPVFVGTTAVARQPYRAGSRVVTVHVAYYRQQRYGHKLVSSENTWLRSDNNSWSLGATGSTALEIQGQSTTLRKAEILGGAIGGAARTRVELRQLLWVGGRYTVNNPLAAVLAALGRLTGQGDDAAAITFFTEGEASAGTSAELDAFVRQHLPAIAVQLAAVRDAR